MNVETNRAAMMAWLGWGAVVPLAARSILIEPKAELVAAEVWIAAVTIWLIVIPMLRRQSREARSAAFRYWGDAMLGCLFAVSAVSIVA